MRSILLISISFLFSSCVQEIPIDIPDKQNQLVVGSIICPEKLISLNVAYINPFPDSTVLSPKILEISIKEDGVIIDHPKGQGPQIYSSTYPKEGSTYELTVITDVGTVKASTTIPAKVLITKADYWITDFISQEGDHLLVLSTSWEDPPAEANYYEFMLLDESKTPNSGYRYDEIDDPVLLREGDLEYEPSSFVLSDKQFDGDTITIQLKYTITLRPETYRTSYVSLRSISEEYYHFKKSWYRHRYLQNTSVNVDMIREDYNFFPLLFQGDPVPLYSNIDQAFGIFAGYTEDIRKFRFVK